MVTVDTSRLGGALDSSSSSKYACIFQIEMSQKQFNHTYYRLNRVGRTVKTSRLYIASDDTVSIWKQLLVVSPGGFVSWFGQ